MIHQHATLEDTVYFWFAANTQAGSADDGATPLFDVRLAGAAAGAAPVLSGTPTLLSHTDYPDGCYEVAVAATNPTFAANSTYAVFCTLAVDGQNPVGFVGSVTLNGIPAALTNAAHGGVASVLTLKQVVVNNDSGIGVTVIGSIHGCSVGGTGGHGILATGGSGSGLFATGSVAGVYAQGGSIGDLVLQNGNFVTAAGADVIKVGCDKTIVGHNLDHLMKTAVASNADMTTEVPDGTVLSNIMTKGSDTSDFTVAADSLEAIRDRGDAAWTTGSVSIFSSTVSGGQVDETAVVVYQHGAFKAPTGGALTWTITDDAGSAIDLSAKNLTFAAYVPDNPADVLFTYASGGSGITVTGDDNNIVNVTGDDTNTKTAQQLRYVIWNTTDDVVIARGPLTIKAEADTVVP